MRGKELFQPSVFFFDFLELPGLGDIHSPVFPAPAVVGLFTDLQGYAGLCPTVFSLADPQRTSAPRNLVMICSGEQRLCFAIFSASLKSDPNTEVGSGFGGAGHLQQLKLLYFVKTEEEINQLSFL
jgi:hypothetical protein